MRSATARTTPTSQSQNTNGLTRPAYHRYEVADGEPRGVQTDLAQPEGLKARCIDAGTIA